jgi:hypothetical protein
MTDVITTDQPVLDGGVRSVHFFNGRLLTGEDLTTEKLAQTVGRLRIGRVLGDGVASGLDVSVSTLSTNAAPVVRVAAGVAINRQGRVLELTTALDVSLAHRAPGGTAARVEFEDCKPLQPGTYSAGTGVYVLTIAPTERSEGRAKVSGLGNEAAACNVAYSVEGVQFHLLRLALPTALASDRARLRNRIAHELAGTGNARRRTSAANPFAPAPADVGLLDDLRRAGCLGDEQVPLAVLMWTASAGVRFIDLWAVRRRVTAPAAERAFPTLVGDRQRAAAEALFLQFEAEIADAFTNERAALAKLRAIDRFAFLPPVGIIPITGNGSTAGFDAGTFLGDRGSADLATTDAALIHALLEESFAHEPIDLSSRERIQRYLIWENETAGAGVQRVLVFAKGTLRYRGVARYGRARLGVSRFAESVI